VSFAYLVSSNVYFEVMDFVGVFLMENFGTNISPLPA
jgi:hypothetical protein